MIRSIVLFVLLSSLFQSQNTALAQTPKQIAGSNIIPPKGTFNILILFAEEADSWNNAANSAQWKKGELPDWANEVVDSDSFGNKGMLSAFFKESSFNALNIHGDYHTSIISLIHSRLPDLVRSKSEIIMQAAKIELHTAEEKPVSWFDNYTGKSEYAPLLMPGRDHPHSIDHVMLILKSSLHNSFATGASGTERYFGFEADSWSLISSDGSLPLAGMKAALGELIMGPFPGIAKINDLKYLGKSAWSLATPGVALFQTINAYERKQLGWRSSETENEISCLDKTGKEIRSDLDAGDSNFEGIYILRDFVKTGDALRIKLPYRDSDGRKQYLWLENHLTTAGNKSAFDNFELACEKQKSNAVKGVYAYLQQGEYGIGEQADLHFVQLPAGGFRVKKNSDGSSGDILTSDPFSMNMPTQSDLCELTTSLAYTLNGNRSINIGTNPSASMPGLKIAPEADKSSLSLANDEHVRIVYLNGVAIELIKEYNDGAIELRVIFDETWIGNNNVWCADSIIVPAVRKNEVYSIGLARNKKLDLISRRVEMDGSEKPTIMYLMPESVFYLEKDAELNLQKGVTLILLPESRLVLRDGAKLNLGAGSKVEVLPGARIILPDKKGIVLDKESIFETGTEAVMRDDGKTHRIKGSNVFNKE